jgi:hypothetical protein
VNLSKIAMCAGVLLMYEFFPARLAVGGASDRSERGRSTLFKNPLFFPCKFLDCYIEAAQNFIMYVTIFAREWGQKTSLTKLSIKCSVLKQSLPNSQHVVSWDSYVEAAQNFVMYVTIFAQDWGQKTSLTKVVLKLSILKQSLLNSQHKVSWDWYVEAAQNFVMYVTIFAREWGQKTSLT